MVEGGWRLHEPSQACGYMHEEWSKTTSAEGSAGLFHVPKLNGKLRIKLRIKVSAAFVRNNSE